jgi:hypothetical protein
VYVGVDFEHTARAGQLHQHPQQGPLHRAGEHLRILAVRARVGSKLIE